MAITGNIYDITFNNRKDETLTEHLENVIDIDIDNQFIKVMDTNGKIIFKNLLSGDNNEIHIKCVGVNRDGTPAYGATPYDCGN